MKEDEMSGLDDLLEEWRQEALALQQRIEAVEAIVSAPSVDCTEMSTAELCEQFNAWADEVTIWLWRLWGQEFGTVYATVDPPPKPPFKG